jgi:hypothetical protein
LHDAEEAKRAKLSMLFHFEAEYKTEFLESGVWYDCFCSSFLERPGNTTSASTNTAAYGFFFWAEV